MSVNAPRFAALVQEAAGIDDAHAGRAIAATLAALAERLDPGVARDLASEVPPEFAAWLATDTPAARFGVDQFIRRVAEREGVDAASAERDVRAVFAALGHAVSPGELADAAAQLPQEFARLLPRGPWVDGPTADEFAGRIARRTGLDGERAMRAAEAVLETLADRISGGEVEDLEARLPLELHPALERGRAASGDRARSMPLESFLRRVAEREGVPPAEALVHARAVLTTLREAVGDEEFFDIMSELPADYQRTLLPAGGRSG
jgi:uncharacterized protein (DUF2267 family)